jgi:hypothetical protein
VRHGSYSHLLAGSIAGRPPATPPARAGRSRLHGRSVIFNKINLRIPCQARRPLFFLGLTPLKLAPQASSVVRGREGASARSRRSARLPRLSSVGSPFIRSFSSSACWVSMMSRASAMWAPRIFSLGDSRGIVERYAPASIRILRAGLLSPARTRRLPHSLAYHRSQLVGMVTYRKFT